MEELKYGDVIVCIKNEDGRGSVKVGDKLLCTTTNMHIETVSNTETIEENGIYYPIEWFQIFDPEEEAATNHPPHYTSHPSGVECIEITRHHGFCIGNAIKYLWRQGAKDGEPSIKDLKKALWYIEDEIKRLS